MLDNAQASHGQPADEFPLWLRIRYADISLNRVKDWILEYPDGAKRPPVVFQRGRKRDAADYMAALPKCDGGRRRRHVSSRRHSRRDLLASPRLQSLLGLDDRR